MRPERDSAPGQGASSAATERRARPCHAFALHLTPFAIALAGVIAPPSLLGAEPGGVSPTRVSGVADPAGDTFGPDSALIDLIAFSAVRARQELVLGLTFRDSIHAPQSGLPNAVYGFVELDADRDARTGRSPLSDFVAPVRSMIGTDLYLPFDSYRADDRAVDLMAHGSSQPVGRVPLAIGARSLAIRIPGSLLPAAAHAVAIVGNRDEVSDVAPNAGFVQSAGEGEGEPVRLLGDRFAIEVAWRDFDNREGEGSLALRSPDSAVFWFFRPDNWELMVKMVNGCGGNGHSWVFAAATTNVAYTLVVTDTVTGVARQYDNPLGTASAAVTDTRAFATCP